MRTSGLRRSEKFGSLVGITRRRKRRQTAPPGKARVRYRPRPSALEVLRKDDLHDGCRESFRRGRVVVRVYPVGADYDGRVFLR